jgi:hypothetical protein
VNEKMRLNDISQTVQQPHSELHDKIWLRDGHLNEEVYDSLIEIANDFIDKHHIPDDSIEDITITGSMANYNWSKYSDVDLHILIDFTKIDEDSEILDDYYNLAKKQWNDKHNITIFGHEVEIYVQDVSEPHHSTGVYSLRHEKWLKKPHKDHIDKPNIRSVERKAYRIINKIKSIDIDDPAAHETANDLMDLIRDMRKEGLQTGGEYSVENMTFKYLRNAGYLEYLSSLNTKSYDKELSID